MKRFCCIAKIEVYTIFTSVERIVNTCIAGFGVIVEDADCLAIADIEDGHAVDGGAFCGVSSGVQYVICTNNDGCIC